MKCWRDLSHECAEDGCPMWMGNFDLMEMVEKKDIGLNESRCALVYKEKLEVYLSLIEIMDCIGGPDNPCDDEFIHQMEEVMKERPGCRVPSPQTTLKNAPSGQKKKRKNENKRLSS